MFNKKEEIDSTKIDTIIGKETVINGTIEAKGILRIEARLQARSTQAAILSLPPPGL